MIDYMDTAEDIIIDDEAEEIEIAIDDVVEDDYSDIDSIADIDDEIDYDNLEDEEFDEDEEYYEEDEYVDYEVSESYM